MTKDMTSGGRQAGFTFIETMLFLAVSGALAVGVLVSAGYAINVQRYRDATHSFVSYIQGVYNDTTNVKNDRQATLECTPSAGISDGGGQPLGTSDCTIVGRLLRTNDGITFTAAPVFARQDQVNASNEADALAQAQLFVDDTHIDSRAYVLEWGTRVSRPDGAPIGATSILVVRSPLNGAIRTFVANSTSVSPATMAASSALATDFLMCVDPQGLRVGERSGAVIYAGASSTSSVKQATGGGC